MNTRVPSEPRYELRKRNHSQKQQKSILLLIHKFEKLSIHEMNEEDLSKKLKESVDPKGIIFPPSPHLYTDLKIDLVICNSIFNPIILRIPYLDQVNHLSP